MDKTLKIAMIASECVPYAKTGGLADVVGALPQALRQLGHQVIVIMPRYGFINTQRYGLKSYFEQMGVWMGDRLEWCAVQAAQGEGDVPIYFIEFDKYFGRSGIYHDEHNMDYRDNARRFAFLARAGLQFCIDSEFAADIVHVHDWPTATGPAYLKVWHWDNPVLGPAAGVLTIHNVGYQGVYGAEHFEYLGLQWSNFTSDKFEDHGQINLLKGGIHYADLVTTVSPTYARETCTPAGGMGMAPYLNNKGDHYVGILNGVDYTQWDPTADQLIPATYSATDLGGKATCKQELQDRFLLEVDPDVPLVGVVSRLVHQKGLHLLAESIDDILNAMAVQFVVLGSGDRGLESTFYDLPARYPGRVGSYIGYNNPLAHWIEAGADFFLMPSLYEPCGLNQMYSLRYGALPIVRATGGLADTVEQYDEATGAGTGFKFWDPTPAAVRNTVGWAVSTYYDRPAHMEMMIARAMSRDFSWHTSALEYERAYVRAIAAKRGL
jgi:starch synthase